jgi:hypothetical protein
MEPVQRFLRHSLRTDRSGARMIPRDEHTLILYDAPEWGDAQSCRLRGQFPECEVTVAANANSLSGFVVIVRRHAHPRARLWASLLVLALVVVGYAAARLHRSLAVMSA